VCPCARARENTRKGKWNDVFLVLEQVQSVFRLCLSVPIPLGETRAIMAPICANARCVSSRGPFAIVIYGLAPRPRRLDVCSLIIARGDSKSLSRAELPTRAKALPGKTIVNETVSALADALSLLDNELFDPPRSANIVYLLYLWSEQILSFDSIPSDRTSRIELLRLKARLKLPTASSRELLIHRSSPISRSLASSIYFLYFWRQKFFRAQGPRRAFAFTDNLSDRQ